MRVMHVLRDLDQGGAQVVVRTLALGQEARGHEVAVAAMPGTLSPSVPGGHFPLPRTGSDPRLLPASVFALHRAIRDFKPDVVHAHNPGIMLVTGLATLRGKATPALATLHGSTQAEYPRAVTTARLTGLPTIACGPAVAAFMAAHGRPVDRTIINGVSLTEPTREPNTVRAEMEVADGELLIVQVGRLAPPKRPEVLVEAFAQADVPGKLVLAGDGPLRGSLTDRIQKLGLQGRVVLAGVRADAQDIMRAADIVALISSMEGLPLALLEAMSLGTAVVGATSPGISELIRDGVDGVLTGLNPKEIGAVLKTLANDGDLRTRLGRNAALRRQEFSADRMVDDYVDCYADLLGTGHRPAGQRKG